MFSWQHKDTRKRKMIVSLVVFICLALNIEARPGKEVDIPEEEKIENLLSLLGVEEQKEVVYLLERSRYSDLNITLIAWHYIHDENGRVKGINTLELVLPNQEGEKKDDSEVGFDGEYENLLDFAEETQELFDENAAQGYNVTVYQELYDDEGNELYTIVIGEDEIYASYGGIFSMYNKTIRNVKQEDIDSFVAFHKDRHTWTPVVLSYDENGNYIAEKSHIVAQEIVTVSETQDDAPVEIVDKVAEIFGEVYSRYTNSDVLQHLFNALERDIPEYTWNVVTDPDGYWVTRDFGLSVYYDPVELYSRPAIYIYANKE